MYILTRFQHLLAFICRYRLFLILFAVFVGSGAILSACYSQAEIFLAINRLHYPFADQIFMLVTNMGDGLFMVIAAVVLLAIRVRFAILTLASLVLTGLAAQFVKRLFSYPRPAGYFAGHESIYLIPDYPVHLHNSFPSGHAATAFSLAVVLTNVLFATRRTKCFWQCITFAMALLIGYSRIYLAQHFFGDVLVGGILGVVITLMLIWWMEHSKWYHSKPMAQRVNPLWFMKSSSSGTHAENAQPQMADSQATQPNS